MKPLATSEHLDPVDYTQPDFGDFYDQLPLWSAPFGLLLLDRVPIRSGITILDVGAGTGFLTLELAQRCGPTSTVIAVDPWTAGVNRLRRKLEQLALTNVRILEQNAADLVLPDASVDVIVSNLGINNFGNAEAVLRSCCRVIKRDGTLVLTTNLVGHMREFYEVYQRVLIDLGLSDRLDALAAHINHRGTVQSVTALLAHAGFQVFETTTDSFRMRFADGSSLLRHYFIRLGFMPGWKSVIPATAVARVFAALERRLNAAAADAGALSLTIPVACVEARPAPATSSHSRLTDATR